MTYEADFNPPVGYRFRGFSAGWVYEVLEWNGKKGRIAEHRNTFVPDDYDHILDVPIALVGIE